jgi:hypothetical protein
VAADHARTALDLAYRRPPTADGRSTGTDTRRGCSDRAGSPTIRHGRSPAATCHARAVRSWTWWLRRIVALVVASQAASLPGIYAYIVVGLVADPATIWIALCCGLVVYGFVFAVVYTLIADGPRQLLALVHGPRASTLRAAPGSR